jgi:hypothetical protein
MNVLLAQRENQSHLHKRAFCHFTFAWVIPTTTAKAVCEATSP